MSANIAPQDLPAPTDYKKLQEKVQRDYFQNLPKQTAPGYVRNKDRNKPCFCGSKKKVKNCCSWKTVANFVIFNGEWQKKINDGDRRLNTPGNRQIDLAGMPCLF